MIRIKITTETGNAQSESFYQFEGRLSSPKYPQQQSVVNILSLKLLRELRFITRKDRRIHLWKLLIRWRNLVCRKYETCIWSIFGFYILI